MNKFNSAAKQKKTVSLRPGNTSFFCVSAYTAFKVQYNCERVQMAEFNTCTVQPSGLIQIYTVLGNVFMHGSLCHKV